MIAANLFYMSGGEKMKLKKMLPFVATVAITLLAAFVAVAFLLRPQTLEIGSVDLDMVTDGEYIGICQNKILLAVVKVRVSGQVSVCWRKVPYITKTAIMKQLT